MRGEVPARFSLSLFLGLKVISPELVKYRLLKHAGASKGK
jgi:hypothetical protein